MIFTNVLSTIFHIFTLIEREKRFSPIDYQDVLTQWKNCVNGIEQ